MKRWPLRKTYFWETSPFFRILPPFAAGIFCYDRFTAIHLSGTMLSVVTGAFLIVFCALCAIKDNRRITGIALFASLQLCMFFTGISLSYFSDVRNEVSWFGKNVNNEATCLVRLTDDPAERAQSWKLKVAVIKDIKEGQITTVKGNAFIYLYKDLQPVLLHKGDSIFVPAKWQPVRNAGNPFEFDYATYCRRNNIRYQQSCSAKDIRLYATNDPAGAPVTERVHEWCMRQLDTYIKDTTAKGLIQAMLLGDEINLDEELRQSYAETGIIHIIAISGGNVLIFFFAISFLLRWLKNKKHLWVKYAVALPLIWFYVMMAGAPPSAIRAAIMFSLLAFSVLLQKNNSSLNTLFATAFILLAAQPMWLFAIGFQLSFVAVLSLILFYGPLYKLMSPGNIILRKLWDAVAASIAAELLVAPLVVYYFHSFPLQFVVANVFAFLFMEVVLILSMATILASMLPLVPKLIGIAVVFLVTVFDHIVHWLQGFNPVSLQYLMITGIELLLMYIIISGVALFLIHRQKPALFTGLLACCLLMMCLCADRWESLQQEQLIVYNTGKANHVEMIRGSAFSVLHTDTAAGKRISYAVKPAHINLRAWRKNDNKLSECFELQGKKVLMLNEELYTQSNFPIDYLVINFTGKPNAVLLKQTYSPKMVVIGNNYTRKQQEDFEKDGLACGLIVHSLANDGAFVLP